MSEGFASEGTQEWYVWTVRVGKFELVKRYIEENVKEVTKVLYPTVTTEKQVKSGTRKKKSPLYAGYIFLQYAHDPDSPTTWLKLNKYPFVTGYVGPCTAKDLASVDSLQKVEKLNNDMVKEFKEGDKVRVNGGVFVGYVGSVVSKNSNSVKVALGEDNSIMTVVFSPEDLDITDRRGS